MRTLFQPRLDSSNLACHALCMKDYGFAHWKALGDWVSVARHQAGFSDMKEWAKQVKRSDRMLLGLERGEKVGPKTIEAISEALGVANWALFDILEKASSEAYAWSDDSIREARERYESETGLEADEGDSTFLSNVPDEELVAEIARRMALRPTTRTERRLRDISWEEPTTKAARKTSRKGSNAPSE